MRVSERGRVSATAFTIPVALSTIIMVDVYVGMEERMPPCAPEAVDDLLHNRHCRGDSR
jgi:hypothetical protein